MASFIDQFFAIILNSFAMSPSLVRSGQIQVNLSNDIQYDNIIVSCKSNTGKDLGVKEMGPGMNFTWAADINVAGKNEIWMCAMHTTIVVVDGNFPIFISNRDNTRCGQECMWSVRRDGIYLYIPNDGYKLQFGWAH
ncbi:hypothetical protein POM88_011408 [Heracleum sosnowskyi]|uniref:S-protein homolog n=1 Tax=Heracleum sosnowskyi TaxID=360622 RepID=A0AAD8IXV7_9APIA|nr:hypothetical protein POM88_011408 [Heracleum sosnowskyi]